MLFRYEPIVQSAFVIAYFGPVAFLVCLSCFYSVEAVGMYVLYEETRVLSQDEKVCKLAEFSDTCTLPFVILFLVLDPAYAAGLAFLRFSGSFYLLVEKIVLFFACCSSNAAVPIVLFSHVVCQSLDTKPLPFIGLHISYLLSLPWCHAFSLYEIVHNYRIGALRLPRC